MPTDPSQSSAAAPTTSSATKPPRTVLDDTTTRHTIYAFAPNRDTLGGTAYLIVEEVTILVDCPAWDETTTAFLRDRGGVDYLFITHRGGIGRAREIQQAFGCAIVLQEQEAYLLPNLQTKPFGEQVSLSNLTRAVWTPGHSPGSACLYHSGFGGILFTGRHLLPTPQGELLPLKTAKTFHWPRQLRSVQRLQADFTPETLSGVCPGANIGFLRGKLLVPAAYEQLATIGG